CSTLRTPASRRWAGSLLFGAGSVPKCKPKAAADRSVQTTHHVRLPALPAASYMVEPNTVEANPGHYDALAVSAYGGASSLKGKARSTGGIRWVNTANRVEAARAMTAALGNHAGANRAATGAMRTDRTVRWNTYVTGLSSYDIKSFTVTLTYTVLQ
ncbi:MAG: hypothetical protein JWQ59_1429, partial [Cryobacterium sp.]|nr:hypothetical protein [Cryobacterium sp.]